jgi:hypothetical protein
MLPSAPLRHPCCIYPCIPVAYPMTDTAPFISEQPLGVMRDAQGHGGKLNLIGSASTAKLSKRIIGRPYSTAFAELNPSRGSSGHTILRCTLINGAFAVISQDRYRLRRRLGRWIYVREIWRSTIK